MASSFPGAIDSFTTKVDGVDDVMAAHVNDLQDAVVAIQTELGVDPAGSDPDVVTRFTNLDDLINLLFTGWVLDSDTWVYVSATSFKIVGKDVRSKFPVGVKLKCTDGGSTKYFYGVKAELSGSDTLITITGGTDYSLSGGAITDPHYSNANVAQGFPDWFNWKFSSVSASGSMTVSNVTYVVNTKFCIRGRWLTLKFRVDMTLGGSASTAIIFTGIPAPTLGTTQYIGGGMALTINKQCWLFSTSGNDGIRAFLYDNSNFTLGANVYGAAGIAMWEIG
jgi:hypothetical protein